jgi:hypothetical protein
MTCPNRTNGRRALDQTQTRRKLTAKALTLLFKLEASPTWIRSAI